ncbi:hypothetical protein ACLESD_08870 [Pyxidicoccus sp. 3LFB2]
MKMKTLTGGWLLVAGLLAGCGGTDKMDVEAPVEVVVSEEQSLATTCPAGSESMLIWECPILRAGQLPCRYSSAGHYNVLHLYCSAPDGNWYDAGPTGSYACGDCF